MNLFVDFFISHKTNAVLVFGIGIWHWYLVLVFARDYQTSRTCLRPVASIEIELWGKYFGEKLRWIRKLDVVCAYVRVYQFFLTTHQCRCSSLTDKCRFKNKTNFSTLFTDFLVYVSKSSLISIDSSRIRVHFLLMKD